MGKVEHSLVLEGAAQSRRAPAAGRLLAHAAGALAVGGGLVLVAMLLVTCASVLSRALFASPILGDFELVERGCAVAVFSFLPYCHLKGGHITVDLFTDMLPNSARRAVAVLVEALFALVAGALTWRLSVGGYEMFLYQETSMMLQIPTWWMFCVVVPSLALLALVCLFRLAQAARGGAQ